jgi:hypothetical protein
MKSRTHAERQIEQPRGALRDLVFRVALASSLAGRLLGRGRVRLWTDAPRELAASSDFREGAVLLSEVDQFRFLLQQPSAARVASLMPLEVLMMGSARAVALIFRAAPALVIVSNPGLDAWSSPGDPALRPHMESIHSVESKCHSYRESGERATGMDRSHPRLLSARPGLASVTGLDASIVETNPRTSSGNP